MTVSSALLALETVMCTPHVAGVAWENVQRRIATVWNNNIETAARGGIRSGIVTRVRRSACLAV